MHNAYHYSVVSRQTNQLIANVEKAINGEYTAIQCYAKLAEMAPSKGVKKQILEIRRDEKRHFQQFMQMYIQLTGRQPQPQLLERCPNKYIKGLEFALKDEQETVDFYLDIADEAPSQYIKETFRRAAADEQNHAVWFLYYFVKGRD
ncbi:ferritin-like domain-containing protein [Bacillus sp. PK3_68]|uniref:ferritin-like domain-containing protein n=1 Tax=Bacillus sp. PK3_68 TaxID=2027408 RepID=UPI000E723D49|nr:ferritin-like domain-containing protein [Bacillus sp. PK3_68]RJS62320.1 rubrerythrin family protein [Bacillus sp. PK3_68]